jgi:MFS family permease
MTRANRGQLRRLVGEPGFVRLYLTRIVSQVADGVFQASLVSAVLFNPERQTDPAAAAAGFAVLLLPYSLIGPFAGVFLDRWSRRSVLVYGNGARASVVLAVAAVLAGAGATNPMLYVGSLTAVSVNRFYLAALSASLPHVVARDQLVSANSVSTTSGTLATGAGGGLALGIRAVVGGGDQGSAVIAVVAAVVYLGSSVVAAGFPARALGPDQTVPLPRAVVALADVARGLAAGARHLAARPPAWQALTALGVHRVCYGVSLLGTVLLYRNYFSSAGIFAAGLPGLAQVFFATLVGVMLAALVTPRVTRGIGKPAWLAANLALAAVSELAFGLPFAQITMIIGSLVLGVVSQATKICVDTTIQESVDDDFRGRVFSLYDTMFNVTFVIGIVVGAVWLPVTGKSYVVLILLGVLYALTALWYARATHAIRGAHAAMTAGWRPSRRWTG